MTQNSENTSVSSVNLSTTHSTVLNRSNSVDSNDSKEKNLLKMLDEFFNPKNKDEVQNKEQGYCYRVCKSIKNIISSCDNPGDEEIAERLKTIIKTGIDPQNPNQLKVELNADKPKDEAQNQGFFLSGINFIVKKFKQCAAIKNDPENQNESKAELNEYQLIEILGLLLEYYPEIKESAKEYFPEETKNIAVKKTILNDIEEISKLDQIIPENLCTTLQDLIGLKNDLINAYIEKIKKLSLI